MQALWGGDVEIGDVFSVSEAIWRTDLGDVWTEKP